jgi:RNA polymerase sigma-70 factor (ECF subfamily)
MLDNATSEQFSVVLQRMADGDMQAFRTVYLDTRDDICRTVALLAHSNDVNDIVNEVYIQIWKSAHTYDPNRPFRSWVHGITVRQVSGYRRKLWKRFRLFEKQKALRPADEVHHDDPVEKGERQEDLLKHLSRLSYKLRAVLILRYYHDYSLDEIAALLQIPVGTVKSRHHLALAKMRESLNKDMEGKADKPYAY